MESIDRTVLPMPDPEFKGKITRTLKDSKADWAHAGAGAPAPGGSERAARADRRRGLRQPGDVRRPDRDAEPDAGRRRRACATTASTSPRSARPPGRRL